MATNYYGGGNAEPVKMDDYGYGTDHLDARDPYSFGSYSAQPQQPAMQSQQRYAEGAIPSGQNQNESKKKGLADDLTAGAKEHIDRYFTDVNYDLLVSKTFYFFFFAAFGSLFPLIGIYFKQLGMNPAQAGMLIGFRPFVELVAGPFWGNVAERWRKWKTILLFSLFCWVAFTLSLAFVQPPAHSCLVGNSSYIVLAEVNSLSDNEYREWRSGSSRRRRSLDNEHSAETHLSSIGDVTNDNNVAVIIGDRENIHRYTRLVPVGRFRRQAGGVKQRFKVDVEYQPAVEGVDASDQDGGDDGVQSDDEEDNGNEKGVVSGNKNTNINRNPPSGARKLTDSDADGEEANDIDDRRKTLRVGHTFGMLPHPRIDKYGMSPLPLSHADIVNLEDESQAWGLVSPPHSAVVYRVHDIQNVFLALLILQVLGEFLSTPAITMADTATLGYLGDNAENYGNQRMFGSIGWAISLFFVGIALDHSNVFANHPCGTVQIVDRNYMTCYAVFSVLMCIAFVAATQFRFKQADSPFQTIQLTELKDRVVDSVQQKLRGTAAGGAAAGGVSGGGVSLQLRQDDRDQLVEDEYGQKVRISLQDSRPGDMISDAAPSGIDRATMNTEATTYVPRGRPGQAGNMPQWLTVLRMFQPIQYSSMLFVLWFMGFGIGLVFTFLFWHLQDIGGTPTLFGMASVVNHLSELLAYCYIHRICVMIGYINVIYAGLIANVIRFICISYLESPWWILPLEFVQGLTHAGVWAAACAYMTQSVPSINRPTAQMILGSLHHAFGRGCGTIIGGAIINKYGTQGTFLAYGITCIFVVVGFFALNFLYISKLPPPVVHEGVTQEASYLAPHGVPGGGVAQSASGGRTEPPKGAGADGPQYGTTGPSAFNGYYEPSTGGSNQYARSQNDAYNQNMYRGGGGVARDSEYGYSRGDDGRPVIGLFQLKLPHQQRDDEIESKQNEPVEEERCNKSSSNEAEPHIRRKFQDFDEATRDVDMTSKQQTCTTSRRMIFDSVPRPQIEATAMQPTNRDRLAFEQRHATHGWLY